MACRARHTWSLSGLVGAFVDLSIAYFLLCASAVAYVASRFLGLFGLCLPCPCTGLGGVSTPNSNFCIKRLLVDYPIERVYSIQLSVKDKFPSYEFRLENELNGNFDGSMIEERKRNVGIGSLEMMEGEASCSSVSDARKDNNVSRLDWEPNRKNFGYVLKGGRSDVKGKGVMIHKLRRWPGRRREGGAHSGTLTSVSSCDLDHEVDSPDSYYVDDHQASKVIKLGKRDSSMFDEVPEEDYEENFSSTTAQTIKPSQEFAPDVDEKDTIKILEQALKEEQAARRALYLELEKERSAAASAADEAMAMILRLQEEKAAVEMEARQYHRIIEEKSAYDAEEMSILAEIVVRREREKHYLEEQVEKYRQIIYLANGQLPDDVDDSMATEKDLPLILDPCEDPVLMLHQLSASIDKKALTTDKQTSSCSSSEEQKYQEKEMVSITDNLNEPPQDWQISELTAVSCGADSSQENNFPEVTFPILGPEDLEAGDSNGSTDTHIPESDEILERNPVAFEEVRVSGLVASDKEPHVHDIHVILDEPSLLYEDKESRGELLLENDSSKSNYPHEDPNRVNLEGIRDSPSASNSKDILRSTSEITSGLPPVLPRARYTFSDRRTNSMSAMDNERSKIDHEIGWLRERLKIIQKGREKLNLSTEHRERENFQLKLLEDITRQLQAIRLLTDSGETVRQKSLPPPSTKVMSKKRRHRSASWGVPKSS